MKTHSVAVLAAVALALLLSGCGASEPSGESENSSKPQVALIMKSLANEFFSTMAEGAERHHAENAADYDLIVNGLKDERDLARQVALVEEMVARGVDAIVIAPADSKALVPVLRRAIDQGVRVVNIDNRLDAEVLAQEGVTVPFVGPDNRTGARKVAEYLAGHLEPGDPVLILEGVTTSFNGQQRRLGFEDGMETAGMVVADSQSGQWETALANTVASSMLNEHPEARAILASNDNMALGAIAAIQAAGREGKVKVVGFDNISAVQAAIRDGKVLATADQHAEKLAVYGIEAALEMLANPSATAQDRETPVDLITAAELTKGDSSNPESE